MSDGAYKRMSIKAINGKNKPINVRIHRLIAETFTLNDYDLP